MDRRDAITLIGTGAAALLVPLSAPERLAAGTRLHASLPGQGRWLTDPERAVVTRIADLVLPRTDTPGALDVGVPAFIDAMAAGWLNDEERERLRGGLAELDRRAGPGGFAAATETAQAALLLELDGRRGEPGSAEAAFVMLKSQVVYGYLTSERVQKDVLRTRVIPGRFEGCV